MLNTSDWFYFAFISAVFSALAALCQKKVLYRENAVIFCVVLFFTSTLFSLPFLSLFEISSLDSTGLSVLLFKSAINAVSFLCVMQGIKKLELSNALPFLVITPGIVAVAAYYFLGESLAKQQILGLIMLLFGAWILEAKKVSLSLQSVLSMRYSHGHWYIFSAIALFSITSVLDKIIVVQLKIPPTAFVCFNSLFSLVLFSLIFLFSSSSCGTLFKCVKTSWKWIALIAIFTLIYRYTQISAIKLGPSVALVLAVKRLSVLFATLVGAKLFSESSMLRRVVAVCVMSVGAYLITVNF